MIFFLIIILRLTRVGISYLHTYKDETYRYVCVCDGVRACACVHVCAFCASVRACECVRHTTPPFTTNTRTTPKRECPYYSLPFAPPSFRDQQLEVAYQRYSHRQRQKSLIMVNGVDLVLKVVLLIIFLVNSTGKTNDHVVVCMRWCLLCFLEEVGLQ